MRIAQVSTVATPVSAHGAGSIESVVYNLAREHTQQGHDVTVFCAAGSDAPGEVVPTTGVTYGAAGSPIEWQVCEWINLCAAVERSAEFDVLHTHAYLWGLPLQSLAQCPVVHTFHVTPYRDAALMWQRWPRSCITSISAFQWGSFPELHPAAIIHHGIDPARHTFHTDPDGYACFLGRMIPGKGPLQAIATARSLGMRLILAGHPTDFYHQRVSQHVDGRQVEYLGPISSAERDRLLGGARVLLYPLQAPEPFGLVLIEAMMSGTPVAAFALGAVPEIVDEGVTGVCVAPGGDFSDAVRKAMSLDRGGVRARAAERFSASRMAAEYAAVYERVGTGAHAR